MKASTMSLAWERRASGILRGMLMLAMLIVLALALPALGAAPQDRVQSTLAAVSAVLQNPTLQGADKDMERRQRVRQIIIDAFDFQEMARESLGGHWGKLTPRAARRIYHPVREPV